jgi:hypothetical protein
MANNFGSCEPRLTPLNDKKHELHLDLNLKQLAKHEELVGKKHAPI